MSARRWVDVEAAARDLFAGMVARPWGQVSPSPYETGRLVVLAPWLRGHQARVSYLLRSQRADGGWGGPGGYGLVPTLSATDALLAAADPAGEPDAGAARAAAQRGLDRLRDWPGHGTASALPDMPAMELVVPALAESIAARLARAGRCGERLQLPGGLNPEWLSAVRALIAAGGPVDTKLAHALEVAGAAARGSTAVTVASSGSIGASAAATAAWLGPHAPPHRHPARQFLEAAADRDGGPVPCALPITAFERAWVLGTFCRGQLALPVPRAIMAALESAGEGGTATSPGLPPDADTTSATLYALARLGRPGRLDSLWAFETATHFSTWPGEQGTSTSVNAHVLEAVGAAVEAGCRVGPQELAVLARLPLWLIDQQQADGRWHDRWHASPYYATMSCAVALYRHGGAGCGAAVTRASTWVLASQNVDGSWGQWGGTVEETAYALHTLLLAGTVDQERIDHAVGRGHSYLLDAGASLFAPAIAADAGNIGETVADQYWTGEFHPAPTDEMPALWHDKDLYLPYAVMRAAVLVAVHLCQSRRVAPAVRRWRLSA